MLVRNSICGQHLVELGPWNHFLRTDGVQIFYHIANIANGFWSLDKNMNKGKKGIKIV